MRKYRVNPKSSITASVETKYWVVNCGFECGDGESGMMVDDHDEVVEAATPEEAIQKVMEQYSDDSSFIGCVDASKVREATEFEIAEYEYYYKPGGPGYYEE